MSSLFFDESNLHDRGAENLVGETARSTAFEFAFHLAGWRESLAIQVNPFLLDLARRSMCVYQPIKSLRKRLKISGDSGFVKRSASCNKVSILDTVIWFGLSIDRNQCTLLS